MRMLLVIVAATVGAVRRLLNRLSRPGTGPFIAGC